MMKNNLLFYNPPYMTYNIPYFQHSNTLLDMDYLPYPLSNLLHKLIYTADGYQWHRTDKIVQDMSQLYSDMHTPILDCNQYHSIHLHILLYNHQYKPIHHYKISTHSLLNMMKNNRQNMYHRHHYMYMMKNNHQNMYFLHHYMYMMNRILLNKIL